ncbi:uncharacterized protein LOC133319952 [Danaus plexippus]|uniref:uncharacterized protein LOC133319952 n=1 Tax=Danaus plexippus TaxID=13037 RepID=UPI002AB17DFE|nr:uncharacterized protein LOC133319952 [Danaus plexippus]
MKNSFRICILTTFLTIVVGWKAIPANQASYSLRSIGADDSQDKEIPDELLPRDKLSFIYKFGWCTLDSVQRQFFRKSVNVTLPTIQSTQGNFLYLVAKKNTQKFPLQCVIMKGYAPSKFLFYKSRLPLFYCQGVVWILLLNTINKYELHEFYLHQKLSMPINFSFEFYHPQQL